MYAEDKLIALSALQHICFCERQCALIHVEQVWLEYRFIAEGRILHDRVDSDRCASRRKNKGKINEIVLGNHTGP